MDKVREFQKRARECREMAAKNRADAVKRQYVELADMWERLAEERLQFFVPAAAVAPSKFTDA